MRLANIVKSVSKDYKEIPINGISFDSRKVKRKDVFFAIEGKKTSGIKFINEAISKGASAVISSKTIKYKNWDIYKFQSRPS